jgi:hypothetical protein
MLITLQNAVSHWKARIHKLPTYPVACPYQFFALILYAFGQTERAVREAERGLEARGEVPKDDKYRVAVLVANLGATAHYYGELGWSQTKTESEAATNKAKSEEYIGRALRLSPDDASLIDTAGFIKIVFSEDELGIEEGLALCRVSWEKCRGTAHEKVSDLFYLIHKRLAYRKILSIAVPRAQ